MIKQVPRKYWPYDEVTITLGQVPHQYVISAPWLSTTVEVETQHQFRVASLVKKMSSQELAPEDFAEVSWFFSSLSSYPFSYLIPLAKFPGNLDQHQRLQVTKLDVLPKENLRAIGQEIGQVDLFNALSNLENFNGDWKWDLDGALQFSKTDVGYDPLSLFSVARRFHLLDSVEANKTDALNQFMREIKDQPDSFQKASALIVRQNHYVTQKCDSALRPALKIAQRAESEVLEFIQAEAGHDAILGQALKAMNLDPAAVPVIEPITGLMELFKYVASKNFLAFAMVVDMFERSSYQDHDPLAALLMEGGQSTAAQQIDIHKDINDAGEHENVALGFLTEMAAVDADYAHEAFQLAELVTSAIHSVSAGLLKEIQSRIVQ